MVEGLLGALRRGGLAVGSRVLLLDDGNNTLNYIWLYHSLSCYVIVYYIIGPFWVVTCLTLLRRWNK